MTAGTLAVVQKSSALAVLDLDGGVSPAPRPLLPQGRWPAWRPGAQQLATSIIELSEPLSSSIQLVHLDGTPPVELYRSAEGVVPVIAPRVPHYIMWSPGGEHLAVVAQGEFGLQLEFVPPSDPGHRYVVETGAPIFGSWSPDGRSFASHIGRALTLFHLADGTVTRTSIEEKTAGFRTPIFTADGAHVLYAVAADPGVAVYAYAVHTGERRELARFGGGVALSALGDGFVSVAVTRQPESGVFDGLWLLDPGAPHDRRLLARGPFASAFWSPTSDRVALLVPSQVGDGRYGLHVRDRDGHPIAASDAFVPSQDLRTLLGFWDQYALSHPLWSPDGSLLAVSGRLPTDAVSSSFGDPIGGYVLLWPPARREPFRSLTPGELAFFPPA